MALSNTALSGNLWSCLPSRGAEGEDILQAFGVADILDLAALKMRIQPAGQTVPKLCVLGAF